jgi:hypothetical protein
MRRICRVHIHGHGNRYRKDHGKRGRWNCEKLAYAKHMSRVVGDLRDQLAFSREATNQAAGVANEIVS